MKYRVLAATVAATLMGTLVGVPTATAGNDKNPPGKPIMVMTRNIYLGTDINRPVLAAARAQAGGANATQVMIALANATDVSRKIVDRTNFPVRAELLADEIAEHAPDLVGLQEVSLWRSGPIELTKVGVTNATTVDYDYLQILLDALKTRGADYTAVAIGNRADVESPSFSGSPLNGTWANQRDVRLTMRDVVLIRNSGSLKVSGTGDKVYAHNLAIPVAGVTMRFDRGYQWVDLKAGSTSFRFVNTHLEAFGSDLALAQAAELLPAATATDRTTVFVCDCNSDPLNNTIKPTDHVPHKAPYDLITKTYTDEWLRWAPAEEGWTSGLSELVNDATAAGFDHRIDMIFGRTASGDPLAVDRGAVTGTDVADRDPATGLWASDHGGVVLRLRGL